MWVSSDPSCLSSIVVGVRHRPARAPSDLLVASAPSWSAGSIGGAVVSWFHRRQWRRSVPRAATGSFSGIAAGGGYGPTQPRRRTSRSVVVLGGGTPVAVGVLSPTLGRLTFDGGLNPFNLEFSSNIPEPHGPQEAM